MPLQRGGQKQRPLRAGATLTAIAAALLATSPASAQTLTEAFAYTYNNNPQILAQRLPAAMMFVPSIEGPRPSSPASSPVRSTCASLSRSIAVAVPKRRHGRRSTRCSRPAPKLCSSKRRSFRLLRRPILP